MSRIDTVQWGPDLLRVSPWRGDSRVAQITPLPGKPPKVASIERCLALLTERNYQSVLTSALSPVEQHPFLSLQFSVHEHLHLLRHSLDQVGQLPTNGTPTRRGRRGDRSDVLAVDHRSFHPFWRFDQAGIADARDATPVSRFRVVTFDRAVVGYAITGRAGPVSYLQRLAVDPDHQRKGIAHDLVVDALQWAKRRGASTMLVNTQERNEAALNLYRKLGFYLEFAGLDVLERVLPATSLQP
ncbi:MAG: GNAT family N-acetyltransferase [Actinomycetes bacterium]